jgi:hypothetical protein
VIFAFCMQRVSRQPKEISSRNALFGLGLFIIILLRELHQGAIPSYKKIL